MKKITLALAIVMAALSFSSAGYCRSGGSQYVGTWQDEGGGNIIVIRDRGGTFSVTYVSKHGGAFSPAPLVPPPLEAHVLMNGTLKASDIGSVHYLRIVSGKLVDDNSAYTYSRIDTSPDKGTQLEKAWEKAYKERFASMRERYRQTGALPDPTRVQIVK